MTDEPDGGSRFEAAAAVVHHQAASAHLHHPEDPNADVVRGRLGRGAVLAAVAATVVTLVGVVALALAVGKA